LRNNPEQQIDPGAEPYWRWSAAISTGFYCSFRQVVIGRSSAGMAGWITFALLGHIFAYAVLCNHFKPDIRWKTWRYDVSEQEIDLLHGVFIRPELDPHGKSAAC
jgi:membrane protein YdbS with pleckstrin-like domain